MRVYEKLYYRLFNAVTDALEELEQNNYGRAAELLKTAQRDGEEFYIEQGQKTKKAPRTQEADSR